MPKRFAPVEHAAEQGLDKTNPATGAKLVSDWLGEVEALSSPHAKSLHGDMIQLERELGAESPDGERIKRLLGKVGPATAKLADKCDDEKMAEKVRSSVWLCLKRRDAAHRALGGRQ